MALLKKKRFVCQIYLFFYNLLNYNIICRLHVIYIETNNKKTEENNLLLLLFSMRFNFFFIFSKIRNFY